MSNEADTCRRYVLPKLYEAGWKDDQISEQKYFTDGRIVPVGRKHRRRPGKKTDYLLAYKPDFPVAVVEAKADYKLPGDGLQQAMAYAEILDLKFAYSTNGHGIVEHDFTTGKQALRRGLIDCSDTKPVPMAATDAKPFLVRPRDVFVVRGNGSKGLVGRAGIAERPREGVIFPDLFIRVSLDEEKMLAEFFVAVWNSRGLRQSIEEKAKTTSGIWKINQSHVASISIPLPDLSEQHRVVERLKEIYARFRLLGELNKRVGTEIEALAWSYLTEVFDGQHLLAG